MTSPQPNVFTDESNIIQMTKVPTISGKQFIEDPKLEKLCLKIIEEKDIQIGNAGIGFQLVYPNISNTVAGKCKKCSKELKYYSGFDFLIQMSGELWDMLDEDTRYTLAWHELLHVKAVFKSKNQEWKYSIRKHDFEDFYEIYDKEGLEWHKTIQSVAGSLYDLDPAKESEVGV